MCLYVTFRLFKMPSSLENKKENKLMEKAPCQSFLTLPDIQVITMAKQRKEMNRIKSKDEKNVFSPVTLFNYEHLGQQCHKA